MNCIKSQFVYPVIGIDVNFTSRQNSSDPRTWQEIKFNGSWNVTAYFNPSRKLQYVLGKQCPNVYLPPSVIANPANWKPFSENATCYRFKLYTLRGFGQFMGVEPVTGTYTVSLAGDAYTTDYLFYIQASDYFQYGAQENWWTYKNIKPWDDIDPFYNRSFDMWNAKTAAQKETAFTIFGGFVNPETELFEVYFQTSGVFAANGSGEIAELKGYNDQPAGDARLNMNFYRGL